MRYRSLLPTLVALALGGCGTDHEPSLDPDIDAGAGAGGSFAHTLFVAREGSLSSYDLTTGQERPGTVTDVAGPVSLQALDDGLLLVNLSGRDEVLVVDGRTMREVARIPSSAMGGVRPVHGYISPADVDGRRYWLALNDGSMNTRATSSARFIDLGEGFSTYLQPAGEVGLGSGHHKASFSASRARVLISNLADCEDVMTVYDYTDPSKIEALATLTAAQAGWDGSSEQRTCDPTYASGMPPAPHGCATSPSAGKAYCNLTSSGEMVVADLDADPPAFQVLATGGTGGGETRMHPHGRYAYTVHQAPREVMDQTSGTLHRACQIGALSVTDTTTDTVVTTMPLGYHGPGCGARLTGTPAETANPGHPYFGPDGSTLYIVTSGGFRVAGARVDRLLVLDTSDPAAPVQQPSLRVGTHTGHGAAALSGHGQYLFVVHAVDGTVSQIDTAGRALLATIPVGDSPRNVATFGQEEGPSHQTGPIEPEDGHGNDDGHDH